MTDDDNAQNKACRSLLATVVLLAVADSCIRPPKPIKGERPKIPMATEAFTAMRFLFDETLPGLNEYATWLDMEPSHFRMKLLETMRSESPSIINGYDPSDRRAFRYNYGVWYRLKNQYDVQQEEEEE